MTTRTPGTDVAATDGQTAVQPPRDGCTTVNIAASSEKAALLGEIANSYRDSGRTVDGKCFDIAVTSAASGTAEANLAAGWDETLNGPSPDVWTPAASTWVSLLQSDLTAKDRPTIVPAAASESVTSTPLVLAMPEPMAKALGWPETPIGWADVLALATDPQGWASKGHPEWGKFTLGKTNPTVSTSGLAATIGTLVAATGTSSDLTQAALQKPEVQQYLKDVESSVVHYGDTTLTYLANLQRADDAGAALGYLSAAAVEEKSVLDYNAGNPSGDPKTLGDHAAPKVPLVAVYPKEGTLYSDSPYVILDAPWASAEKKAGAQDFLEYLQLPEQQKVFTDSFFRTADHAPGDPITSSPYLIADGVTIALNPPSPDVLRDVRSLWAEVRKSARVLVLMDVSGSMASDSGSGGKSKLDLAKSAATTALDQLVDTDQVGFSVFTTDLPTPEHHHRRSGRRRAAQYDQTADHRRDRPTHPAERDTAVRGDQGGRGPDERDQGSGVDQRRGRADRRPKRIHRQRPGRPAPAVGSAARRRTGCGSSRIAYGPDADLETLQQISEASTGGRLRCP